MAIAVVQVFHGGTLEQYDQVIANLKFTPGGQGAPGGLFHWVTASDGDIRITDVWESRETFEAYARDHIGPATAAAGVQGPPEVTFYDVHNYLTAGQQTRT